ncbi:hypothetical protein GA0115246_110874 [Streptomyces sp. SolWspMP-sol7th]|nr:hypothetical protein GA0115246_110874 [Streptomyces sp. SolWspMP-sol7th]
MVFAEVDAAEVTTVRESIPVLANRRLGGGA